MKREINIDKKGNKSSGNWGYVGEKNMTHLIIELPDSLIECDYCQAEITANGTKTPTDRLDIIDGKVIVVIPLKSTTYVGKITVQLIGYVVDESGGIFAIGKSSVFEGKIHPSTSGVITDKVAEPSLLQRIWAKIQAWADKIHTHDNKKTLDQLYCKALEDMFSQGDDEGYLRFRGDKLRPISDGVVIKKVEEIEKDGAKFLRLLLNKGGGLSNNWLPDFIDIPVSAIKEVEEENPSFDFTLNGSELELPSGTGGIDKIELTAEAATLQPNVYYNFGEVATLTLEFAEGNSAKVNEYMFGFISGETPTVLTLPSSVQWVNELTVEANKRYEISIVDNIGLWCAVEVNE